MISFALIFALKTSDFDMKLLKSSSLKNPKFVDIVVFASSSFFYQRLNFGIKDLIFFYKYCYLIEKCVMLY